MVCSTYLLVVWFVELCPFTPEFGCSLEYDLHVFDTTATNARRRVQTCHFSGGSSTRSFSQFMCNNFPFHPILVPFFSPPATLPSRLLTKEVPAGSLHVTGQHSENHPGPIRVSLPPSTTATTGCQIKQRCATKIGIPFSFLIYPNRERRLSPEFKRGQPSRQLHPLNQTCPTSLHPPITDSSIVATAFDAAVGSNSIALIFSPLRTSSRPLSTSHFPTCPSKHSAALSLSRLFGRYPSRPSLKSRALFVSRLWLVSVRKFTVLSKRLRR
jgi:hypothetical protein